VAVEPQETEFGLKRTINQTSCNKDLSCLKGFCPSFVLLEGARPKAEQVATDLDTLRTSVPEPQRAENGDASILITGIGGTGIVTLSAILGTAAHMDGKKVSTLDMTGLAQKGGAVLGHVRISSSQPGHFAARISSASASVLLAADLVTAASGDVLDMVAPDHTVAVINTHVSPTADFVLHQHTDVNVAKLTKRLERFSKSLHRVDSDGLSAALLGNTSTANVVLLGYAFQRGLVPLTMKSLERAIELNGVLVDANLAAFHYGRVAAHDFNELPEQARRKGQDAMYPVGDEPQHLDATLASREAFLHDYQDARLAMRYEKLVRRVKAAEKRVRSGSTVLTQAVAEAYFKLLAYKDEYEVARLYTDGRFADKLARQFEPGFKMKIQIAPPYLTGRDAKTGRSRKIAVGTWILPLFKLIARFKGLRGTRLDPFGYTRERKLERALIGRFEGAVDTLVDGLDRDNLSIAVDVARAFKEIRGYGVIKDQFAVHALIEIDARMQAFTEQPTPIRIFDPRRAAA
ncbi:MAG: 2-oxoacid:acceptor oxidoreductase family protein, partial [Gammaproteobacteria bacterium]|nr:2-oxoacid:acceptor oxidoreductase family protein [Gammaproteobacteria bacterium]